MNDEKEIIQQLYSAFEQAALEIDGVECWSARELQALLGYSKWENFANVINKAKLACEGVGHNVSRVCQNRGSFANVKNSSISIVVNILFVE